MTLDKITESVKTRQWFKGLDSLRFVMALIVLFSHFSDPIIPLLASSKYLLGRTFGLFLLNAFDGTAAVIAFFIISGFVIHYPNKNGIINIKIFWIRRFLRVLLPLTIIYLVGIHFNHPDKAVIWSLICELFYYALYPLLSRIKVSWSNKFLISYLIAIIVIVIGAHNDIYSFFLQTNHKFHGYYWQLGVFVTWIVGLPIWLLGVLIAEKIDQFKYMQVSRILFYRIGVFILSYLFVILKVYFFLSYIVSMNFFALLIYKWLTAEIVYYKTTQPVWWIEKMGKYSYSLYLCHPLIYVILSLYFKNDILNYPFFIILTIIISYFFYLAIEKPAHLLAIKLSRIFN